MQNFRDAVKRALKDKAADDTVDTPWDSVLGEFAASINEEKPSVFAFVRRGGAPTVRHLVLAPKGRRDQGSILLSLEVASAFVVILSGDRREFTDVEDFETFLLRFARLPAFQETLRTLTVLAGQPVAGSLRFGHAKDRSPARDIGVKVNAAEQHRLAEAAEKASDEALELCVELAGVSLLGQGTYDAEKPPRWLVAGGYLLDIATSESVGLERVRVRGIAGVLNDLE
jgi:hypothetical protein